MAGFVPHTDADVAAMLADLGLSSVDDLFAVVPVALRLAGGLDLPAGLSEPDTLARVAEVAAANSPAGRDLVCFAGGGAYDHDVPSVVRQVAFRSEFVTAYTPYQAEVAQGVLQALFEYQTVVARLFGMEVANASLYDGASACVEAANLAAAATGRHTIWVSRGVHPHWRQVLATLAAGTGHDPVDVPLTGLRGPNAATGLRGAGTRTGGTTAWPEVPTGAPPAALVVQSPNYLGCIEDLAAAGEVARRTGALLVVAADPVAAGLVRAPGEFGADVVVGEGQPFGTPLSFGGPYLGLFACRRDLVRRLPGRLVGETVDTEGRRAYVTTLRTREQDIRREKASSNVCTNQTLVAVAFVVHLAWLGTAGLRELALRCARGTRYAREMALAIDGVEPLADAPVVREFALRLPVPAATVVERMAEEGVLAGIALDADDYGDGLLVAVTERRTRDEIDAWAAALEKAVR
ncbi:MAG: aminomethyl-transferring glycine dehydrogenase subunit GcvPA [Acidimicrobiales bacterium]